MSDKLKVSKVESKGYGNIYKLPMQDTDLDVVAKAFYAYICSFAGQGDTAFPGMDKICKDLGVSRQRLERHRKALVKKGYISINQIKEAGKFARNEYTINKEISPPMLQNATTEKPTTENVTSQNVTINNNSINNNSNNNNNINNKDNIDLSIHKYIVEHLNDLAKTKFRHNTKSTIEAINGRLKDGYKIEDVIHVIEVKCEEWIGTNFEKNLNPTTLFRPSNFERYVNQKKKIKYNNTYKPWEEDLFGTATNSKANDNYIEQLPKPVKQVGW